MTVKRSISSAALGLMVAVGVSLAEPAEATGYFHHHYYQPYGYHYPNHGYRHYYRPRFYGHGYRPYFGHRGNYCPPKSFYSHGYYKPLIHHAIDAIVVHGFYGH